MTGRLIPARRFKDLKQQIGTYLSKQVRPLLIEVLIITLPDWFDRALQWLTKQQLLVLAVCLTTFAWPIMTARPTILQQGLVALALLFVGQILLRLEDRQTSRRVSEYLHLLMAALSTITTLRYLYYRSNYTLNLDSWLDGFFSILLFWLLWSPFLLLFSLCFRCYDACVTCCLLPVAMLLWTCFAR